MTNNTESKPVTCNNELNLIKKQGQEMLMVVKINEVFATENKELMIKLQDAQVKIMKITKNFDILMMLALALLIIVFVSFIYSNNNDQTLDPSEL